MQFKFLPHFARGHELLPDATFDRWFAPTASARFFAGVQRVSADPAAATASPGARLRGSTAAPGWFRATPPRAAHAAEDAAAWSALQELHQHRRITNGESGCGSFSVD